MPTLLVTRRMSPALAARVEASVRGRRAAPGARLAPRRVSLLRLALVVLVLGASVSVLLLRRKVHDELAQERQALIEQLDQRAGEVTPAHRERLERARTWLRRSALAGAGEDEVAPALRGADEFARALARPTVYVRGQLDSFRTVEGIEESAALSSKDAFVLCLIDPPAARTEKALLGRARTSYGGGSRMRDATAHLERLHTPFLALPLLTPEFRGRAFGAKGRRELADLRRQLDRAPFEAALRALGATQLLFVMDEPSDASGPTELDGERPHPVRVGLVDLVADRLLLQVRRRVDPRWLSDAARAEYASGIDSCSLALDVHEAVGGAVAARAP